MLFNDISYLFCLAEWNHLCNFGRGHYEEHFCEIILNLEQWFGRRCCLKYFSSTAMGALLFGGVDPFVQFWYKAFTGTFLGI